VVADRDSISTRFNFIRYSVMKRPECILNDGWLGQCMSRFSSDDALFDFAIQWESAAHEYLCWLQEEGFTTKRSLRIIDDALERANFDLNMFPVCP
jgi:hypothetical protein